MTGAELAEPQHVMNTQSFWNEFMRRPDAKAAYIAERELVERKKLWLEEKRAIDDRSEHRALVAEALEDAPADIKKLVAPMFHIRIVEQFLWMVYDECKKKGGNFLEHLREEGRLAQLRKMRENFQLGGEERMQELEDQWYSVCHGVMEDEEKKKDKTPASIDIHTLKHVLEFGQECKREGNIKFREGLYEEALHIYSQGDEVMKKWKVEKHLKNEHKWLQDYHLACLKNKAQAALKLEKFNTALEAAEAALKLDPEDHKAWYRKVQAEKGLGRFKEAEQSLSRIEDIAQWCPDRLRILRDCEAERKRIKIASAKHKVGTKNMLGKAFEAGVFSVDRQTESQEAPAALLPGRTTEEQAMVEEEKERRRKAVTDQKPLEREIHLTAALAGDLIDELAVGYGQGWFQERVRKCARDSGYERSVFLMRLKVVAFEVQKPILMKWGFEGNDQGLREMTAAIREHASTDGMPAWLKEKQDKCLELLYGGKEGGMLEILT